MALHVSSSRTGTRVPFGDATSRANTPNAPQPAPTSKHAAAAYVGNSDATVAMKLSASVSAAAPSPPSVDRQQRKLDQYYQEYQQEYEEAYRQQAAYQHAQQQAYEQQQRQRHHQQDADHDMTDAPPLDLAEASKRHSATSGDSRHTADSKRASQYSSCDGFPNKKSHIGPWQLGKTLGKGSSARVRAARHCTTHQPVAVKIIAKKTARMTQSGSIAQLDQFDSNLPENINGVRRMPLAIEREVAILKLIEHPNIVKLYDIWENRNEIYLILEYVENGDLFTYVSQNGAMTEEVSIFVFRQMMSAVQYCHAYNICHRDLKPENILLKADGQIKIADFGMAALHQGPRYQLQTSCGSPHYAAPELLKARPYRGDKADIWSMGVILFVMLAGRLPFDEDDMGLMLAKAKKGIYTMPGAFSPDAKDLVHRILQIEPEVRISMNKMWQHPLIWKYGYLDDLGSSGTDGQGQGGRGTEVTPLDLASIDTQIFRQLRSMWHTLREDDLAAKLVSNEPNDQKLFYWLLHGYRERQQEDYNPTLTHSVSDYHHVNQVYSKKVSTRKFSQSNAAGHKRSVSRFTVISNVAETEAGTEAGTVKSYDPYKSSIVMEPSDARASHAKIVVHRNNPNVEAEVRSMVQAEAMKAKASGAATKKKVYIQQRRGSAAYLKAPRGSMSSIRSTRSMRSMNGKQGVRPTSRHKRGVDFSKARKPSAQEADPDTEPLMSGANGVSQPRDTTPVWNEDLTDFSCRIAKDLDDAFMSSLLVVDSSERDESRDSPFSLRLSSPELTVPPESAAQASQSNKHKPWHSRPLPPSPPRSESVKREIMRAKEGQNQKRPKTATGPKEARIDSAAIGVATSSNTKLQARIVNVPPLSHGSDDRRIVSAPVYSQSGKTGVVPLPSIYETKHENWPLADKDKPRASSAPSKKNTVHKAQDIVELAHLAQAENTIRLVVSPTTTRSNAPITTPRPLSLPKQTHQRSLENGKQPSSMEQQSSRQQQRPQSRQDKTIKYRPEPITETIVEETSISNHGSMSGGSDRSSILPTRLSWFKRQSKTDIRNNTVESSERPVTQISRHTEAPTIVSAAEAPPYALSRKKSFIFPFWKTSSKSDTKLSVADGDSQFEMEGALQRPHQSRMNSGNSRTSRTSRNSGNGSQRSKNSNNSRSGRNSWNDHDDEPNARKIEPQQNWLSRLFRVKPATRHLCLGLSQRRARQEVVMLLRDWRRYGIRDIEVDKERNIVFAKVGAGNYLGIREVAFACEIITVIEHGKRNHLSILRLTQEKGSANSFHKVADTIKGVMRERHLVVPDKRKAKMMVKTLNS
ncbi:CAMK/CAMKL/GIN4 protein kinase [Sporothrix schenckii ATCC 58251]|uniref:non-specific serine/threonine protein kinase n=1 Tax=Sporothrix schenckii (strain ATCC 58251 / de Perez 2211183) TaxID=1391915 RepID=U7PWP7_SPOS1|nr:CAMK/CAMKL/GIN4 protein kinase [Sporothrix schenckii ATCC 58251]